AVGLHGAGADRGDRLERIALAEHVVAGMQRADVLDQHVQVAQARLVHALRQAGLGEGAGGAESERIAVVGERRGVHAGESRCHADRYSRSGDAMPGATAQIARENLGAAPSAGRSRYRSKHIAILRNSSRPCVVAAIRWGSIRTRPSSTMGRSLAMASAK